MNLKNLLVGVLIATIPTVSAVAQKSTKANLPNKLEEPLPFSVVQRPNQGVVVKYNDGRQASLLVRELPMVSIDMPLQVEETTCAEIKPQKCSLKVSAISVDLALRWTKNSDKNRLNKDVLPDDESINGDPVLDFDEAWTNEYQNIYPEKASQVAPYELTCDDFRFLTASSNDKTAPANLTVVDWGNEIMAPNSETQATENRMFFGAINVQFEKSSEQSLKIKDIGTITAQGLDNPILFFGDIIGWTIRKPNSKEFCQISFKADSETALATVFRAIEELENKTPFKPFIPEQDPILAKMLEKENTYDVSVKVEDLDIAYRLPRALGIIQATKSNVSADSGSYIQISPKKVK